MNMKKRNPFIMREGDVKSLVNVADREIGAKPVERKPVFNDRLSVIERSLGIAHADEEKKERREIVEIKEHNELLKRVLTKLEKHDEKIEQLFKELEQKVACKVLPPSKIESKEDPVEFIYGVVNQNPMIRAIDIVHKARSDDVCSQATVYRIIEKLIERNKIIKHRRGKFIFYSTYEKNIKDDLNVGDK